MQGFVIVQFVCFLQVFALTLVDERKTELVEVDAMPPSATLALLPLKTIRVTKNTTLLDCALSCHEMESCQSLSYGTTCDCVLWAERYGEFDNLVEEKTGCNFFYVSTRAQIAKKEAMKNEPEGTPKPKEYFVIKEEVNYTEATRLCREQDGRLLTIFSAAEQATALSVENNKYKATKHLWFGLKAVNKNGVFRWSNGKTINALPITNYHNKWAGNPSVYKTNIANACIRFGTLDGWWTEQPCTQTNYPFCEKL